MTTTKNIVNIFQMLPVDIDVVYRRIPIVLCKGFKLPLTSIYVVSNQLDFI